MITTSPPPQSRPAAFQSTVDRSRRLHPWSLVFEIAHLIRSNLVPVLFAGFGAAAGGATGFFIGLAAFIAAAAYSVIRFATFRYRLTATELLIDQGLIFKQHRSVPLDRIENIDTVQNLFHRFLRIAEVRIETASGNEAEATMRVLGLNEIERLRQRLAELQSVGSQPVAHGVATAGADPMPLPGNRRSAADAAEECRVLLAIPTSRLIAAGLLSNRGLVLAGLAVGYVWQAYVNGMRDWRNRLPDAGKAVTGRGDASTGQPSGLDNLSLDQSLLWLTEAGHLALAVLALVAVLLAVVELLKLLSAAWYVLKFHDYRLTLTGNDLRIHCGLLTKISVTIPRDRIQIISVQRTWAARLFGLAAIRIETTSGEVGGEESSSSLGRQWFVPVLGTDQLPELLSAVQPGLSWEGLEGQWHALSPKAAARMMRLPWMLSGLLIVAAAPAGLVYSPALAIALVSIAVSYALANWFIVRRKAANRRFAETSLGFIYRSGTWTRKTSFGFWDRLHSVSLLASPLDRRWKMAKLRFDTAGAGVADHELRIAMLDERVAHTAYETACRHLRSAE